ncbi:MAG TPA: 4-aminobutyrate--2-oxoglutarate transaminase [Candidatus Binataceae bacterium]|nr:4-aminobutyrate--2-oxoglutarate transaminase [Candidatus Binataceae bacterium]
MNKNAELRARIEAAIPRGVSIAMPIVAARAEGAQLFDVEGRRYIDFAGGISVLNVGHRHPRVIAAATEQMNALTHACFQVTPYESYIRLAERLNQLVPGDFPKKTIFLTTGAEAIENAIKIARYATGRSAIISFSGGFHGRTMMTLAATGKVAPYKLGFGPMPPEVFHAPFPDAYRGGGTAETLHALEAIFKSDVDPARVAAILIEPVQGEGGFNVAPFDFMRELRALCDRHGILLIADEIQTGFGRTARMFAVEHSQIAPDLMAIAKSLAGGFPLAGVTGRADVMDKVAPGGLGGTYAGNPIACAAALAVLDVMRDEDILGRAEKLGKQVRRSLDEMSQRLDCIGDVRGLGAMLAVELVKNRKTKEPAPQLAQAAVARAASRGLVIITCGVYGNVMRIMVPLNAPLETVDEGLSILEASLTDALGTT